MISGRVGAASLDRSRHVGRCSRTVSAVTSISVSYDGRYLTGQVAKGAENYYVSAVTGDGVRGEPPGVWTGRGCEELGLVGEVDNAVFEKMVDSFADPRDPNMLDESVPDEEKDRLGRPPRKYKDSYEVFEQKVTAEPEATPERRQQLWIESKKDGRQAAKGLDLTFSPDKSVTLLHMSLQAKAQQAQQAGDQDAAAMWNRRAELVWDAVMAGNNAMLEHIQDNAGQSRAGYHGKKVEGRTTGRYVSAKDWIIASFRQHTNRDELGQLHIHNYTLNRVLTEEGKWRTLDSRAVHQQRAAGSAAGERAMEERMSATLGTQWVMRPDGTGRQIAGVDQELINLHSSRRVEITDMVQQLLEEYQERYGHQPSARALFQMSQYATKATKAPKHKLEEVPTRAEQLAAWEAYTQQAQLGSLTEVAEKTLGRVTAEDREYQAQRSYTTKHVVEAALADVQAKRAVWDRSQLIAALQRHLPDGLGGLDTATVRGMLDELADQALAPGGQARLLNAPQIVALPTQLQREDGTSIYEPKHAQRYATVAHLDKETKLLDAARAGGTSTISPQRACELLGITPAAAAGDTTPDESQQHDATTAETEASTAGDAPEAEESRAVDAGKYANDAEFVPVEDKPARGLRMDQAAVTYQVLTDGRQISTLVGPAGAGKSYTVGQIHDLWKQETGGAVFGLTTAQKAAYVLAGEGFDEDKTFNIKHFFREHESGKVKLKPGAMLVIDEGSMVPTSDLDQLRDIAQQAGAKILLTGDPQQLEAPGSGGAMRQLVTDVGAYELTEVTRMREQWERDASLRLRDGDLAAITEYDKHGRLEEGSQEDMQTAAYEGWLADHLAGRDTLLIASTAVEASELANRARADLVRYGHVDDTDAIEVTRKLSADESVQFRVGVGDVIQARLNARKYYDENDRWVANRDVLRVVERRDASLLVERVSDDESSGQRMLLPNKYVRENVELAYAGTVHAAQGRTVDTCHSLLDERSTRELAYVSLSRGRLRNLAYVITDRLGIADPRPGTRSAPQLGGEQPEPADRIEEKPRDRFDVLAEVVEHEGAEQTALEALRGEQDRASHLGNIGAELVDLVRQQSGERVDARLRELLSEVEYEAYENDEAKSALAGLVRQAELAGHNADQLLTTAVNQRNLTQDDPNPADSIAQVLHWRVTKSIGDVEPVPATSLVAMTPTVPGEIGERMHGLAEHGDARRWRLGEAAAEAPPAWATEYLGEVPEDPIERDMWVQRASLVEGYREQFRPDDTDERQALGPAPSKANPEARAAWHAAYDALGRPEADRDVAAATDGQLWIQRAAYAREHTWAPTYVAEELRTAETAQRHYEQQTTLLEAQAAVTTDADERAGLEARAARQRELGQQAQSRAVALGEVDQARARWYAATEDTRVQAMRADAELRKRHPDAQLPALTGEHDVAEQQRLEQRREAERPQRWAWLRRFVDGRPAEPQAHDVEEEQRRGPEVPGQMEFDLRAPSGPEQGELDLGFASQREHQRRSLREHLARLLPNRQQPQQESTQPQQEAGKETAPAAAVENSARVEEEHPAEPQLELDLGLGEPANELAAELRATVERARHAQQVLEEREQRRAAERAQAEQAEADREGTQTARRVAERQQKERELKQEAEREPEEREAGHDQPEAQQSEPKRKSPAEIASEAFPTSVQDSPRQPSTPAEPQQRPSQQHPGQQPRRGGPQRGM